MYHHLRRAKDVYRTRGAGALLRRAAEYAPIEVNNLVFRARYGEGTHVVAEDWDTLILLDACRYDMFADVADLDGQLESRISRGSTSEEFLAQNFGDGTYHDTVYVNANGYIPDLGLDQDGTFHAVVNVLDEWDEELETVLPEAVASAAREAHVEYPNKRVIVHFMQPHIPFITEAGRAFQERLGQRSVWTALRDGQADVGLDRVWELYEDNLRLVLTHVETLLDDVSGKVVVSADHGNFVGERQGPIPTGRMYGHPWGVYAPELVKVPWFVVDAEERREIRTDPPVTGEAMDDETVQDRLRALGYA
jgi:hypothetical protein